MKRESNHVNILCLCVLLAAFAFPATVVSAGPLKVFILAGQSNMEGQGEITDGAQGNLQYMYDHDTDGTYAHLKGAGDWVLRDDVWIYYLRGGTTLIKGGLTVGMGAANDTIGPELQFGHVMGDYYNDQVLLIKTAWGGKSLAVDFRPPSSGGTVGPYYTEMMSIVADVLDNLSTHFPAYGGQGYEIIGFGWHQGWNDRINQTYNDEYEYNMANFIRDIRSSEHGLGIPNLPFVIATTGMSGWGETHPRALSLMAAQLAMEDFEKYPEFEGNVAVDDTRDYWRPAAESPADQGYHWNRNAETYFLIGNGLAVEMIDLIDKDAPIPDPMTWAQEPRPGGLDPVVVTDKQENADEIYFAGNVSNTDLIEGTMPSSSQGPWESGGTAGPEILTNGIYGNASEPAQVIWDINDSDGSFVEYTLGTGDNGLGYDITSIRTFSAWSSSDLHEQHYKVFLKKVSEPFAELTEVNFQPTVGDAGATQVTLTSETGILASGVEAIRFEFLEITSVSPGDPTHGATYREFDIQGVSTPIIPPVSNSTSISMIATSATDNSGVEYYFECTGGGGHDSGWQDSPYYTDTGLAPETEYTYTVTARDKTASHNTTAASTAESATTDPDNDPPIPDPMTWARVPASGGLVPVVVTDKQENADEIYFAGNVSNTDLIEGTMPSSSQGPWESGGTAGPEILTNGIYGDAGELAQVIWDINDSDGSFVEYTLGTGDNGLGYDITSIRTFSALGWANLHEQHYKVFLKKVSEPFAELTEVNFQPTVGSAGATQVTLTSDTGILASGVEAIRFEFLEITAVLPGGPTHGATYREFDIQGVSTPISPPVSDSTSISMMATSANDISGVEYYFECTGGGGNDSGWQDSKIYTDTGLSPCTQYTYRVRARDTSPAQNTTGFSATAWATTTSGIPGDVTGECVVDTVDLFIMARDWLQSDSVADIYPSPYGDDIVNLFDFSVLAKHWLEGITP